MLQDNDTKDALIERYMRIVSKKIQQGKPHEHFFVTGILHTLSEELQIPKQHLAHRARIEFAREGISHDVIDEVIRVFLSKKS